MVQMTIGFYMAPAPRFSPAQEEVLILDAATHCINESSLLDFKMSNIAKRAGISMGSVYKHVKSKEDVLVALASRLIDYTRKVMLEIMTLPFSAPERLICTVLIDPVKLHEEPFGLHLQMLIGNEAIMRSASASWVEKLAIKEESIEASFTEILQQDDGLLETGERREQLIEALMVGLWSIHVGFTQVAFQRAARYVHRQALELPFPVAIDHPQVLNAMHVINAYPWKTPLTMQGIEKMAKALEKLGYR